MTQEKLARGGGGFAAKHQLDRQGPVRYVPSLVLALLLERESGCAVEEIFRLEVRVRVPILGTVMDERFLDHRRGSTTPLAQVIET